MAIQQATNSAWRGRVLMMNKKELEALESILDYVHVSGGYCWRDVNLDLKVLKGYYDKEINKEIPEITEAEHNDWHSQGDGWGGGLLED